MHVYLRGVPRIWQGGGGKNFFSRFGNLQIYFSVVNIEYDVKKGDSCDPNISPESQIKSFTCMV